MRRAIAANSMIKLNLSQKIFFSTSSVICILVMATLFSLDRGLNDTMSEKINADLARGKATFETFFEERFEALFVNARIVADAPSFKVSLVCLRWITRQFL